MRFHSWSSPTLVAFAAAGVMGGGVVWAQKLPSSSSVAVLDEEPLHAVTVTDTTNKAARWVLGLSVSSNPAYSGASRREVSARPVLSGQVGRWMISTSSARRMSGQELAGGISTTVLAHQRWQFGLGLRITHGRDSGDDPQLVGMPDIPSSLNLRVSARYQLSDRWQWTNTWQQDVGHAQGLRWVSGLNWQYPLAEGWGLDGGVSLTWANARAMRVFYGVAPAQALPGRTAWDAGAGVEQVGWGLGVTHVLSPHWRMSASVGQGGLMGDAAHSPLTQRRWATQAQFGLAYVGW